jgi:hypothetical protein
LACRAVHSRLRLCRYTQRGLAALGARSLRFVVHILALDALQILLRHLLRIHGSAHGVQRGSIAWADGTPARRGGSKSAVLPA